MDFQTLIASLMSHAQALGVFDSVNGHQPVDVPNTGVTCAVWAQEIGPDPEGSGLSATTARIVVNIRIYTSAEQTPYDAIDPQVMNAVSALMTSFSGDFTLGGTVRDVELMEMKAEAGYIQQQGNLLRVMTITVPIVINDLWAQSAVSS